MPEPVIEALSYLIIALVSWLVPPPRSKQKRTRSTDQ